MSGWRARQSSIASPPLATEPPIPPPPRRPSSSSSASLNTWLSSTRTTRTPAIPSQLNQESLLGRNEQGEVRLAALVHIDLDVRMPCRGRCERRLERWRALAGEEREHAAGLGEQTLDDRTRGVVEARLACERL